MGYLLGSGFFSNIRNPYKLHAVPSLRVHGASNLPNIRVVEPLVPYLICRTPHKETGLRKGRRDPRRDRICYGRFGNDDCSIRPDTPICSKSGCVSIRRLGGALALPSASGQSQRGWEGHSATEAPTGYTAGFTTKSDPLGRLNFRQSIRPQATAVPSLRKRTVLSHPAATCT